MNSKPKNFFFYLLSSLEGGFISHINGHVQEIIYVHLFVCLFVCWEGGGGEERGWGRWGGEAGTTFLNLTPFFSDMILCAL